MFTEIVLILVQFISTFIIGFFCYKLGSVHGNRLVMKHNIEILEALRGDQDVDMGSKLVFLKFFAKFVERGQIRRRIENNTNKIKIPVETN